MAQDRRYYSGVVPRRETELEPKDQVMRSAVDSLSRTSPFDEGGSAEDLKDRPKVANMEELVKHKTEQWSCICSRCFANWANECRL